MTNLSNDIFVKFRNRRILIFSSFSQGSKIYIYEHERVGVCLSICLWVCVSLSARLWFPTISSFTSQRGWHLTISCRCFCWCCYFSKSLTYICFNTMWQQVTCNITTKFFCTMIVKRWLKATRILDIIVD